MPPKRGAKPAARSLIKRKGPRKPAKPADDNAKAKWLHHRLKLLKKVLKKAKVFEVRKIQRRIAQFKSASPGDGAGQAATDVSKLQLQLECVKSLDLEQVAQHAAQTSGLADASGAAPAPKAKGDAPKQDQGGQQGAGQLQVVRARLLRSGAVKKEVEQVVSEFNKRFRTKLPTPTQEAEEGAASGSDDDGSLDGDDGGSGDEGRPAKIAKDAAQQVAPKLRASTPASDDAGNDSDDSGIIDMDDIGQLSDLSEDLGAGDADAAAGGLHGAGGSGSADDDAVSIDSAQWDRPASAADDAEVSGRHRAGGTKAGGSDDFDDGPSSSDGEEEEVDEEARKKEQQQQRKQQQLNPGKKDGGTRGLKGSSPPPSGKAKASGGQGAVDKTAKVKKDKYDPRKDDPLLARKPKNRLSQRARQKLAEQKYGRQAKHLQQQQHQAEGTKPSKRQESAVAGEAENLHPSWAAKRKQTLSISAAPPAGKKIKFDADGEEGRPAAAPAAQRQGARPGGVDRGRSDKPFKAGPPQQGRPGPHGGASGGRPGVFKEAHSNASAPSGKDRKVKDDKPLHPSWEARKKLKEKAAAMQVTIPKQPTGKKVVFDD